MPPSSKIENHIGRSKWTREMYARLKALGQQGLSAAKITAILQHEFKTRASVEEVTAEWELLKKGPKPTVWTPKMVQRVKQYLERKMNVFDITTELFNEFAKPDYWQETYRKIQEMKLNGEIV
ncbi:MAG: hypothetical protein Q9222_003468 [Ikaeria aurantiellina]